jgi:hypothetical protein
MVCERLRGLSLRLSDWRAGTAVVREICRENGMPSTAFRNSPLVTGPLTARSAKPAGRLCWQGREVIRHAASRRCMAWVGAHLLHHGAMYTRSVSLVFGLASEATKEACSQPWAGSHHRRPPARKPSHHGSWVASEESLSTLCPPKPPSAACQAHGSGVVRQGLGADRSYRHCAGRGHLPVWVLRLGHGRARQPGAARAVFASDPLT